MLFYPLLLSPAETLLLPSKSPFHSLLPMCNLLDLIISALNAHGWKVNHHSIGNSWVMKCWKALSCAGHIQTTTAPWVHECNGCFTSRSTTNVPIFWLWHSFCSFLCCVLEPWRWFLFLSVEHFKWKKKTDPIHWPWIVRNYIKVSAVVINAMIKASFLRRKKLEGRKISHGKSS